MSLTVITACRACDSRDLRPVLALGEQPLANALKQSRDQPEARYPLSLMVCPACGLLQIAETIDKTKLFSHYVWVTGTSPTSRQFARRFSELVTTVRPLAPDDLVVEIASNDGTFLQPFLDRGIRAIGVDPAANVAAMANAAGVPTRCAFWSGETAVGLVASDGPAALIIARNVIAHVSELHDVIGAIRTALAADGVAAIEFHAAPSILAGLQYDSIYHEHLCYFSATSFERLLQRHGMHPFHVDFSPISGGAQIIYCAPVERPVTAAYAALLESERADGIASPDVWQQFGRRCLEHRDQSRELLARVAARTVVGYGASARSATYLNFCGFTGREFAAVIDNSPLKHGTFTPGSTIPIVAADEGFALAPDLVFVLAWNFKDEIIGMCRQRGYRGDFLVPFPGTPHLVPAGAETLT